MPPKIVFADMDGTFLATDKSIPKDNLRLLDALERAQVPFVPCTGRPAHAVPEAIAGHAACTHVISANGACVSEVGCARMLRHVTLSVEAVLDLYGRVRDLPVTFDVFEDGRVLSERARYDAMGEFGLDAATLSMLRAVRRPVDLTVPEMLSIFGAPDKVTCFWGVPEACDALVRELEATRGITYAKGHPQDFEVQAPGASKGEALVWLCGHLGVDVADSVAFGDEGNDVSLVEAAGDGVAMGNASEAVKAVSDHVTLTCDEAGVAHYLGALMARA